LGKYDDVLKEHQRRVLANDISDHYCSKRIQDELLNLLAKRVQEIILSGVKKAKYFAIILDCTPDLSHKQQMYFTIGYVDLQGLPKVVEHFICFQEVKDSSGEGLTEVILRTLASQDVNIADCREQGYDNGTNMRGKKQKCAAPDPGPEWSRVLCAMRLPFAKSCGWRRCGVISELRFAVWCYSAYLCGFLGFRVTLGCSPSAPERWIYCETVARDTVGGSIDCPKPLRYHTAQIRDALMELEQDSKSDPALRHECGTLMDSLSDFTNLVAMVV
jgi:hypothetical protein